MLRFPKTGGIRSRGNYRFRLPHNLHTSLRHFRPAKKQDGSYHGYHG